MKLAKDDIDALSNLINTCAIGGIESIIIEDGMIRGLNESRTFVILSSDNVPKFPQKIGLGRLTALRRRMELFAGNEAAVIQAIESDRGEISSIDIAAGRNKVQVRCTSTVLIKAPKSINHTDAHKISLSKEELKLLMNATRIMGSETVQLIIKKDGTVSIVVNDDSNDAFSMTLDSPAEILEEADSVVHYYHAPILSSVIKELSDNDGSIVFIGDGGSLKTKINGHWIYVLPKVDDTED